MNSQSGNLTVILEGRGQLVLRPNDHVATGGEGSVYRASNTIVKVYTDPQKMRRDGMPEKLRLLATLTHPYIVAPKGLVCTLKGDPIGYYMDFAPGEPLPRLFTNDFRQRAGFGEVATSTLVNAMRDVTIFAHDHDAVPVDANELNWLAVLNVANGPEPRAIDVDAWAIGRWPATVIMPSVRDWHSTRFGKAESWFTWGCVTFPLYTGIHPYKGTLPGFDRNDLEGRMKANASVFSPDVRLNRAVRDFSCIPGALLDWYIATFQQGERTAPPSPYASHKVAAAARVLRVVTTATSGNLTYKKLFFRAGDAVIRVFPCGVALLESATLVDLNTGRTIGSPHLRHSRECEVIRVQGGWLRAENDKGLIKFFYIDATSLQEDLLSFSLECYRIVRYENRLFVTTIQGLTEVLFRMLGKPLISHGQTWGAMLNATHWFDGVGVQDALGASYLIVPFDNDSCAHIRVRELDGIQPITAKTGTRFVTVTGLDNGGVYHKFEFTFDKTCQSYTPWQQNIDSPDINAALLPRGVCVTITEDGTLSVFVPSNGKLNRVQDKQIATDMQLAHWEDRVVYIQNGEVWSLSLG